MQLLLILLTLTSVTCWTSCATTETPAPQPPVVIQWRPALALPPAPAYPRALDWQAADDGRTVTLPVEDFRELAAWRLRVEAYYDQIAMAWALMSGPHDPDP